MVRPSWDDYFLSLAKAAATRATCLRKQVGAVLVLDRRVVSVGYNGSPPGEAHCTDEGVGCLMEHGHCVATVHAEVNAIAQAARHGTRVEGATAYVTIRPCPSCNKLLLAAGVSRVVWADEYP